MEDNDAEVKRRIVFLRRHLQDKIPLAKVAAEAGIPIRTARRWLERYRTNGPSGLQRVSRSESGSRQFVPELVDLIEGMALLKPPLSIATIYRRVLKIAKEKGWRPASYSSVRGVVRNLDPALLTLAHEGAVAFRNKFELVYRHRAEEPNGIWQADHTQLDLLTLDANGREMRPWLTTVIDDYSRVLAGYLVFYGAPSALNTSLALRQAIWRKEEPEWQVCGIPDVLYVDHGSDFTSIHLEQAAVDLRFQLIYSAVARPQGRGKVERLFRTINTELLPELPGHLQAGKPATPPRLSLSELDAALRSYIVSNYHTRVHSEIGQTPLDAWRGDGWLPRIPETLEELDALLIMVAKSRKVHRDGIKFEGFRFSAPTLAAYVGESVTIRYDPRDMSEIRVFYRNAFLCRAISPEHDGQTVTLKDIQAARVAYRRRLRNELQEKKSRVSDFLPATLCPAFTSPKKNLIPKTSSVRKGSRLRTYLEGD